MTASRSGRWTRVRRPRTRRALPLALTFLVVGAGPVPACDICAIYTATEQSESRAGVRLGVATQYTHFGTVQEGGTEVPNPAHQVLDSVVTQIVGGYQLTPRVGVQLNLPIIDREFRRIEGTRPVRGSVAGVGDLSLLANVLAHSIVGERSVFRFSVLGGLKLPTGNPDRLGEELDETQAPGAGARARHVRHTATDPPAATGVPENAVHGHDLALGSGSVDGVVAADLFWSWDRWFVSAALQYAIRTEGAFDYRFANDLTWGGGPGVYLLLGHEGTLSLQALTTGETKGNDTQAGRKTDDTAVTSLYLGPRLSGTWGTSLAAEIAADLPFVVNNTSLQIVPDYRIRAAAVWRF